MCLNLEPWSPNVLSLGHVALRRRTELELLQSEASSRETTVVQAAAEVDFKILIANYLSSELHTSFIAPNTYALLSIYYIKELLAALTNSVMRRASPSFTPMPDDGRRVLFFYFSSSSETDEKCAASLLPAAYSSLT